MVGVCIRLPFVFFFQAEDGIRDVAVTGVQTCALPISFTILNKVGAQNPKSVLATTILSFSISSVLTGAIFFLMGACRLGSLIGFFPQIGRASCRERV